MSKRVIGSAEILGNLVIKGQYAGRTFNGTAPNSSTGIVDYPIYKRSEVQEILDMLPVSRIGDMDYLPLNVNGSFTGASSDSDRKKVQPCIIEDDGTAVILRAGTNGSSAGFYYSYMKNFRNIDVLTQNSVINTTTEYKPSNFIAGDKIDYFFGSNGYEVLFYKIPGGFGLSLTNGTFNEVSHNHIKLASGFFHNNKPIYANIVGDKVFCWVRDTLLSTNNGFALRLYTIPVASIRAGDTTGSQTVIQYSGETIRGAAYSSSAIIRVYDKLSVLGTDPAALFEYSGDVNGVDIYDYNDYNIQAVPNSTGTKVRVTLYPQFRPHTALTYGSMYNCGFSFVYDVATKSCTWDTSIRSSITVSYTTDFIVNDPYAIDMVNFTGADTGWIGNCGSISQTSDGVVLSTRAGISSIPSYGIIKYQVQGSKYDSWVSSTRVASNRTVLEALPTYGSAVGDNLIGIRFIDKRKILLACSGTENGVTYGYDTTVYAEIGQDPTYTYNTLSGTTLQGFAPQPNRRLIDNNSTFDYTAMISTVEFDGTVKAYGSSFIEGVTKKSGGYLDPVTLQYTTEYTIDNGVLDNLKANIIASTGITGLSTSSKIILYYVPDQTFSKSIATLMCFNPTTFVGYAIYAEVDVTLNGQNVTGATVFSTRYQTLSAISNVIQAQDLMKRFSGLTIAKYNGFNYIGIDSVNSFASLGDLTFVYMIGKIKNGTIVNQIYNGSYYAQVINSYPGVIPGVGFGYYNNALSDQKTKSVFSNAGSTEADMDNLLNRTETPTNLVVISQDVAQGYIVYFTQDIPVFLGGIYDRIPVTSIDLSTIKANPANSAFNVYISMDRAQEKASYVIREGSQAESLTFTYIGTIITGATGITSIKTEKVTRFLTYRTSPTSRGSAIPTSTGVPSGTGTRWKN